MTQSHFFPPADFSSGGFTLLRSGGGNAGIVRVMTPVQRFMAAAALVFVNCAVFYCVFRPESEESAKAQSVRESLTAEEEAAKIRALAADLLLGKKETLALIDKAKDPHYWIVVASSLAFIQETLGAWREAELLHTEILHLSEQHYGPETRETASALETLARFFKDTNRPAEAEPLLRRALVIYETCYSVVDPVVARNLSLLGMVLKKLNRLEEAEPLLRRALAINEQCYGKKCRDVGLDLQNLVDLLMDTNRLEEAEPLMRRTVEVWAYIHTYIKPRPPELETAKNNYRSLLLKMGETEVDVEEKLLDIMEPLRKK